MSSRYSLIADRQDRAAIDAALDAGTSLRTIALAHSISKTTLIRYRDSRQHQSDVAPVVRVRSRSRPTPVRPGAQSEATDAAPCAPDECGHLSPTEAKLRDVAKLLAQGLSREEIATRYRVSVGTVTDWHRKIKENGIALVQSVTAENVVATLLTNMEQRSAALWRIANRAEIAAPRIAIAALDGLRKEDQHVAAMADTLGVLGRFKAQREEHDPESLPNMFRDYVREASALFRDEQGS